VEPDNTFDFAKLRLTSPTVVAGGSHFIKFALGDKPLYIQPPNCLVKNGIVKTGKRFYCDLMFTNVNADFIQWMENLETHCRKTIYENRKKWFETELEEDDIENSFTPSLKLFKSGKYYIARIHIPTVLGKTTLKIYDEQENLIDSDQVKDDASVATILEIQGVKCSPRMFQIEMEMKQLLLLKPVDLFDKCLLKSAKAPEVAKPIVENLELEVKEQETKEEEVKEEQENLEVKENLTVEMKEGEQENIEEDVKEEPENLDIEVKESNDLEEIHLDISEFTEEEPVVLKERNDVYYKMYRDALQNARAAKEMALTSYLEAKRIKNTYMLDDDDDEDDEDEEDELDSIE
jgi:hypothetical protein